MVEAGWILTGLRSAPDNTSETALEFGRMAYFTGADFVLQTIKAALSDARLGRCEVAAILATMNREMEIYSTRRGAFFGMGEKSH